MVYEPTRREFLLLNLSAGLAVLLEPGLGQPLSQAERRTLLGIARTLFPHSNAHDNLYAGAIDALETRCRCDATTLDIVRRGTNLLESATGGHFSESTSHTRTRLLKTLEERPFFRIVYAEMLQSLYGSPTMWLLFGSSAEPTIGLAHV